MILQPLKGSNTQFRLTNQFSRSQIQVSKVQSIIPFRISFPKMNPNSKCPKLPWMIEFHSSEKGETFNQQYSAAFASTALGHLSDLTYKSKPSIFRSTQLICTLTSIPKPVDLENSFEVGISIVRIATSRNEIIKEIIGNVRTAVQNFSKKLGRPYPVGLALEMKGPLIRTGKASTFSIAKKLLPMRSARSSNTFVIHLRFSFGILYERLTAIMASDLLFYILEFLSDHVSTSHMKLPTTQLLLDAGDAGVEYIFLEFAKSRPESFNSELDF